MNKVTYTEEKAILWKDNKANMEKHWFFVIGC